MPTSHLTKKKGVESVYYLHKAVRDFGAAVIQPGFAETSMEVRCALQIFPQGPQVLCGACVASFQEYQESSSFCFHHFS